MVKNNRELHYDQSDTCLFLEVDRRLVSIPYGYIWLTDWQTVFKYLTHKKINVFLLFCSLKCWMCIKMRKIIFRIDMTFLVHKGKEITSRREYYFFAPIQEITIFPSMFIFWYIISPFFFFYFSCGSLPFIPLTISN